MKKCSLEERHQLLLAALYAANECERLGGFTTEHLPALMAAINLNFPPPVAKKRPLEWKEATKAGHAPGTWPHYTAHIEDIASRGVTIKERRKLISEINASLETSDKNEKRKLTDERHRLQSYCIFLESMMNDIVVAISTEIAAVERLLKQAAKQKPKADTSSKRTSSKKSDKITPELLDASFSELCRGNTRDIERRHQAARRLIEIVLKQRDTEEYSKEERDAIETRLRSIVKYTIMLSEPNASQEQLEQWVGNWIANVLHGLGIKLEETPTNPLEALSRLGIEAKLQPERVYETMQASIRFLMETGVDAYDAVSHADEVFNKMLEASKKTFAYSKEEISAIEDAHSASAVDLFPQNDSSESPPEGLVVEEIKNPPQSLAQADMNGFKNNTLETQLRRLVIGVKEGTITVTSKALNHNLVLNMS